MEKQQKKGFSVLADVKAEPTVDGTSLVDELRQNHGTIGAYIGRSESIEDVIKAYYELEYDKKLGELPGDGMTQVFSVRKGDLLVLEDGMAMVSDTDGGDYVLMTGESGKTEIRAYTAPLMNQTKAVWRIAG